MKTLRNISDELLEQYARQKNRRDPKIVCRIKDRKNSESYSCSISGGQITLDASSNLAAVYGVNRLLTGIGSGHLAECAGEWHPRFPLRPLWIGCDVQVSLNPAVSIALPQFLCQEKTSQDQLRGFCRRVIEMGFNSILFGSMENSNVPSWAQVSLFEVKNFCSIMHEYGLKLIFAPQLEYDKSHCPLDVDYASFLEKRMQEFVQLLPDADYVFWTSQCWLQDCLQNPLAREATQADLVRAEILIIEKALQEKIPLIHFLPSSDLKIAKQQAEWLPALCDDVSKTTILSFSAVAGHFCADHLPPHPLWQTLRMQRGISATPLMPIVNIGSIKHGEGLWPALTFDLAEKFIDACDSHCFAGVIGLVNKLPAKGSLLDCSLWISAQAMWKKNSTDALGHTWFLASRPELNYLELADSFRDMRDIVVKLSWLRSFQFEEKQRNTESNEECRAMAESLAARLKLLQVRFEKEDRKRTTKAPRPSINDYFIPFAADVRSLIAQATQACNVSIPNLRKAEDNNEGFWTQKERRTMLETAQRGLPGSRMSQIFEENRLF